MTKRSNKETRFVAEVVSRLGDDFDVIRLETALDDGLPDLLVQDKKTGNSSWIEVKIGEWNGDVLNVPTLQQIQILFLTDRKKARSACRAMLLIGSDLGMYICECNGSPTWMRAMSTKRILMTSLQPVEWSTLMSGVRPW